MTSEESKLTDDKSFEESVDRYEMRLLTLEVELAEMHRNGSVSKQEYRKRYNHLKFLHGKLEEIKSRWATKNTSMENHDPSFAVPDPSVCTPDEIKICFDHFKQRLSVLAELCKESTKIKNWVNRVVTGQSSGVYTTFHLSALRTGISKLDSRLHDLKSEKKGQRKFLDSVAEDQGGSTRSSAATVDMLRAFFAKIKTRNERLYRTRKTAQDEEERVKWLERWLIFQEQKMQTYYPMMGLPNTEVIRSLSREVLSQQIERSHDINDAEQVTDEEALHVTKSKASQADRHQEKKKNKRGQRTAP